jgi:hypothetical protein
MLKLLLVVIIILLKALIKFIEKVSSKKSLIQAKKWAFSTSFG